MSTRSRKEAKTYKKVEKHGNLNTDCVFCRLHTGEQKHIQETKSFMVIRNIYGYSSWDNHSVEDHLMIVPKIHTDTLSSLTAPESIEFLNLLGSYEIQGYSIWARAPQSAMKSVIHQHTHLIKAGKKKHRILFYLSKPYLRITR